MAHVKDAKWLFPLKMAYMCWMKTVHFSATPDSPQG